MIFILFLIYKGKRSKNKGEERPGGEERESRRRRERERAEGEERESRRRRESRRIKFRRTIKIIVFCTRISLDKI